MSCIFVYRTEEMNSQKFCYEYPRAAITTDCVVFSFTSDDFEVLLIQRGNDPFKEYWALPGGFMQMDETAEECAKRELFEETGIKNVTLEQLYAFTQVERDPRGRTISISFIAFVNDADTKIKAGDDAGNVGWFSLKDIPPLAFDHDEILRLAVKRLLEKIPGKEL